MSNEQKIKILMQYNDKSLWKTVVGFSEVIFDMTTIIAETLRESDVDSREVFQSMLEWALEFELEWNDRCSKGNYLDYLYEVGIFTMQKLEDYFQ